MKRPLNSALRLGAVLAVGSLLAIGSGSVDAGEAPDIVAAVQVNPSSTTPDSVVLATALFEHRGSGNTWSIGFNMQGTDGAGTFAGPIVTEGTATNCQVEPTTMRSVRCDWSPTQDFETTTITVNVIVAANATPFSPGWEVDASEGIRSLASTNLEIVAAPPVGPPVTEPSVTDPPAVNPPASGGTPAAAPTQLPATGTSMWPFVLVGLAALAAGAGALRLSRSD